MKKILFFILGALTVIVIGYLFIVNASAGPKECPPGQRGDCSTYQQKETLKIGCFPNNANLGNGWIFLHSGCEDDPVSPTSTDAPPFVIPTSTPKSFFPTSTYIPSGTPATIVTPTWNEENYKHTPTSTLVLILNTDVPPSECTNNCLCLIATQLSVMNDLERTQIAVDLQQNSCPVPKP